METEMLAEESAQAVTEDSATSTETTDTPEEGAEAVKAEDSATSEAAKEPERKPDAQDRIKQLVAKQREAERRAAYLEGQLEASKKSQPEKAAEPVVAGKPTPDKFATYDEYTEALAEWKAKETFKAEQERVQREDSEKAAKNAEAARKEKFSGQMEKARAKHEDFDEATIYNPDLMMTKSMLDVIEDSDFGADIAYFLGKNPQESARIAQLNPMAMAKEIGKLEMKFSNPPAPEVRRVTSAAPPVNTLGGGGVAVTVDPSKMSDSEWYAWHKSEQAKKYANANKK